MLFLFAFVVLAAGVAAEGLLPGERWALIELHGIFGASIDKPMMVLSDVTDTLTLSAGRASRAGRPSSADAMA